MALIVSTSVSASVETPEPDYTAIFKKKMAVDLVVDGEVMVTGIVTKVSSKGVELAFDGFSISIAEDTKISAKEEMYFGSITLPKGTFTVYGDVNSGSSTLYEGQAQLPDEWLAFQIKKSE